MRWTWVLLLAACQQTAVAPTRAELVAQAENAEERADWRTAAERWQRLYETSPDSVACRGLARVLRGQEDYEAALRVLSSCAEPDAALLLERSHWYEEAGHREAALADLEEVYSRWPDEQLVRLRLATLRLLDGDVDGALALSRERVGRNPDDSEAWTLFATTARVAGAEEEERGAYLQLHRLRGLTFRELRRLAELTLELDHDATMVEQLLETALDSDPSHARGWRLLARARQSLDDEVGRIEALNYALEADPGDQATLASLALALIEKEDWERVAVLAAHARATGADDLAEAWLAAIPDEPEEEVEKEDVPEDD